MVCGQIQPPATLPIMSIYVSWITSPTGGGCSVGIVRSRTKATELRLMNKALRRQPAILQTWYVYFVMLCKMGPFNTFSRYSSSLGEVPYIFKSNPHPNLLRTSFCRFLKRKKLVRGSNPHLSFNRPLHTRQTDLIILDVTNASSD